jgi:hypothetical protein
VTYTQARMGLNGMESKCAEGERVAGCVRDRANATARDEQGQ